MTQERWAAVDRYLVDTLVPQDEALEGALRDSAAAGLPGIHVMPNVGKFLNMLAQLCGARRILEIGTLGGYSTIWLARALPAGGRLIALEADARHAGIADANISRAGLSDVVELRVGRAQETLPALVAEGASPFDMIFIDADKPSIPAYFEWALQLSRVGSLMVVDNVVRNGAVADARTTDPSVIGVRTFLAAAAAEKRVSATVIQMVGAKGYDGMALVRVVG